MTEPLWLRGAAVSAALAGLPTADAVAGFAPREADALRRALDALRAGADRAAVAHGIARERVRLGAVPASGAWVPGRHARAGAAVLAVVLRRMPADDRAALIRALDPSQVRAAAAFGAAPPPRDAKAVVAVVTHAASLLHRMPTIAELGSLVEAATGADATAPWFLHAALRSARACGNDPMEVFGPFAALLDPPERGGER